MSPAAQPQPRGDPEPGDRRSLVPQILSGRDRGRGGQPTPGRIAGVLILAVPPSLWVGRTQGWTLSPNPLGGSQETLPGESKSQLPLLLHGKRMSGVCPG